MRAACPLIWTCQCSLVSVCSKASEIPVRTAVLKNEPHTLICINLPYTKFAFFSPMIGEFMKRGLYRTVHFLAKIGYREDSTDTSLSFDECSFLALFNLKEYARVCSGLSCPHFQEDTLVFCTCHVSSLIFVRNYALLIRNPRIKEVKNFLKDRDEFLLYLEAAVSKDPRSLARMAIEKNELFWEAYEYLQGSTVDVKTDMGRKLLNLAHMSSFCHRGGGKWHLKDFSNLNLAAAVLYTQKEYKKSEDIFERVVSDRVFDLDYIDLYSNILYLNRDPKLGLLAQRTLQINRYRPETHIVIGNYYSLKKDHTKAIEYFLKAAWLSPRYAISYTLIGHEYMEMKNTMNAIRFYTKSIKMNVEDYRAWFGMAQAYGALRMHEYSLIFFRKSIEMRPEDGFLWLSMGQAYSKLRRDDALKCFAKAVALDEAEGLLHAADFHKAVKKYSEAVKLYEKYVDRRGKDFRRISVFLNEYFSKIGNRKKAEYYGLLS